MFLPEKTHHVPNSKCFCLAKSVGHDGDSGGPFMGQIGVHAGELQKVGAEA